MAKVLKPMMFEKDFNEAIAHAQPIRSIQLSFTYQDIDMALEFWLNNVVFRSPVEVELWRVKRDGTMIVIVSPEETTS